MKVAVTYEDGRVFAHFGKTRFFKFYEITGAKVLSAEVHGTNGLGHGALAGLLREGGVDVLICGGLGEGAKNALASAGITVISGAQGDADDAIAAFLRGELVSCGVNCHHHDHADGHSCGDHGCGKTGC